MDLTDSYKSPKQTNADAKAVRFHKIDLKASKFSDMKVDNHWFFWPIIFLILKLIKMQGWGLSLLNGVDPLVDDLSSFTTLAENKFRHWPESVQNVLRPYLNDLKDHGFSEVGCYQTPEVTKPVFSTDNKIRNARHYGVLLRSVKNSTVAAIQIRDELNRKPKGELLLIDEAESGNWLITRNLEHGGTFDTINTVVVKKASAESIIQKHQQRTPESPMLESDDALSTFQRFRSHYMRVLGERELLCPIVYIPITNDGQDLKWQSWMEGIQGDWQLARFGKDGRKAPAFMSWLAQGRFRINGDRYTQMIDEEIREEGRFELVPQGDYAYFDTYPETGSDVGKVQRGLIRERHLRLEHLHAMVGEDRPDQFPERGDDWHGGWAILKRPTQNA